MSTFHYAILSFVFVSSGLAIFSWFQLCLFVLYTRMSFLHRLQVEYIREFGEMYEYNTWDYSVEVCTIIKALDEVNNQYILNAVNFYQEGFRGKRSILFLNHQAFDRCLIDFSDSITSKTLKLTCRLGLF